MRVLIKLLIIILLSAGFPSFSYGIFKSGDIKITPGIGDKGLVDLNFPVPHLSGDKTGSIVQLKWMIGSQVTKTIIEESKDGINWKQVYSGLGSRDSGNGGAVLFLERPRISGFTFVAKQLYKSGGFDGGPIVCPGSCGSSTFDRTTLLSSRKESYYEYRAKNCNSSTCTTYSRLFPVGTKLEPKPVPPLIPRPPSTLNVPEYVTESSVNISWTNSHGAKSYQLEQQKGNTVWNTIYSGSARSFSVSNLTNGSYKFRVKACNLQHLCGVPRLSNVLSVSIPIGDAWKAISSVQVDDATVSSIGNLATVNLNSVIVNGKSGVTGGQASYQIPINLPPGRFGVQPNVSINVTIQPTD